MDIGNAIKTCRIRRGYSQTKLAELAECSVSYLSLIEHNQRDITLSTVTPCTCLSVFCYSLELLMTNSAKWARNWKRNWPKARSFCSALRQTNKTIEATSSFSHQTSYLRKESRFWRKHFSLIRFLSRTIKNARSDDLAFCNQYRLNLTSCLLLSA